MLTERARALIPLWNSKDSSQTYALPNTCRRRAADGAASIFRRPSSLVVPAKAGTHTPRPLDLGTVANGFCSNKRRWLWVPAFAGTTQEDSIFKQLGMSPPSRRWFRARFGLFVPPSATEGAGKAGCALHPRSRVQECAKKRTRAYRFSGGSPAFPAQWFYGL
jgi:hypothetical protein